MVEGFGRRHYVIAALAALIIIAAFLFARVVPSPPPSPQLSSDAYPLYSGVAWTEPKAATMDIGGASLAGVEAASEPVRDIADIASVSGPFEAYYDDRLKQAGWSEDIQLAADGPGSSVRVFRKENLYTVIRYESAFKAGGENEPAQCPCDLTLFIFTGTEE